MRRRDLRVGLLYWPVVVLVLFALARFLTGSPDGGLWSADPEHLRVYLVIGATGMVVAGAGRMLMTGGPRTGRMAVVWIAGLICIGLAYASRTELTDLYDRIRGNIHPSVALSTAQGEAELHRAWDGHYRAEAEINGVPVMMLVDTGASMVLLPYESVHKLGIDPRTLDYSLPVTTANGKSSVAPVTLSSIKIGPIAVFDVEAAVARPGKLKAGLLGMSFLDRLDETSFRGGRLLLRN